MGRAALLGIGAVLALAGCASRGGPPTSPGPSTSPSTVLTSCVYEPATASPTRRPISPDTPAASHGPAVVPSPNPSRSLTIDEQWNNRVAENHAYRKRRVLQPAVVAATQPYARAVCEGLQRLRAGGHYAAHDIEQVLAGAGLSEVDARPRGRLDVAGNGGLVFGGWTGQACVFGEHGPTYTEVNVGSQIADGGCIPAPD